MAEKSELSIKGEVVQIRNWGQMLSYIIQTDKDKIPVQVSPKMRDSHPVRSGDIIKVEFEITSKEWNHNYYAQLVATKITPMNKIARMENFKKERPVQNSEEYSANDSPEAPWN